MPRLKSRTQHPPGGFVVLIPGAQKPFSGSFSAAVDFLAKFRRKNPTLCEQHHWSLEPGDIENDVDTENALRLMTAGFYDFVEADSPASRVWSSGEKKSPSPTAAVAKITAGVGLLLDWLGSGGVPVAKSLAEKRASICVTCPKNDGGDWTKYFTVPMAKAIKQQLEIKHELDLKTSQDAKLTVCSACDCSLPLKVFTPLEHILTHTSEDTKSRLDPRCWILNRDA